jgi:hypothetical protein
MARAPNPQLKPEVFTSYFPQFEGLPKVDLRVLMWHFLGANDTLIAQRCGQKKVDVNRILDRHDPERTLSLNREIKLAYIDHSVLDMAAGIISTITADDLKSIEDPEAKLRAIEKMLKIHSMLLPFIPKDEDKGDDDADAALGRMKKCH